MKQFLKNLEIKFAQKEEISDLSNEILINLSSNQKFRDLMLSTLNIEKFGKYSILALNPLFVLEFKDEELILNNLSTKKILKEKTDLKTGLNFLFTPIKGSEKFDFQGFWTGFFNYNLARQIEPIKLPEKSFFEYPDFSFVFSDTFLLKNHLLNETFLIFLDTNISEETIEQRRIRILNEIEKEKNKKSYLTEKIEGNFVVKSSISKEKYKEKIKKIKDYIFRGDVYQVNFTYPLTMETKISSKELFLRYTKKNPIDFASFINRNELEILSISPECFFILKDNKVLSYPVKGTIKRGSTQSEDKKMRQTLVESEKDRAELAMIVDLIRNDIGKVANPGTVLVKQHASLETFQTLYHLYSAVEGEIDLNKKTELFLSMFPGGSITGAPKIRAMEIISELEEFKREIYTGSIGIIGFSKDIILNIAIRTIQRKNDKMVYFTGGGITIASDEDAEFEETLVKSKTFFNIFEKIKFE